MLRVLAISLALCAVLALSVAVRGGPPDGQKDDPTAGASYVGVKACKKCHMKQHRSWKKMKHAKAWEALPAKYQDPAEKDDQGRACVSCHVTGYGQADRGGFENPEKSAHLLGVQCEACHGPGSKHKDAGQKVLDAKRKKFNADEPSFNVRKTAACSNCHNPHISHKKYAEEK